MEIVPCSKVRKYLHYKNIYCAWPQTILSQVGHVYKKSQPYTVPPAQLGCNTWRVSAVWLDHFHPLHTAILGSKYAKYFLYLWKYFSLHIILQSGGLQREQLRRSYRAAAAPRVHEVSQLRLVPD